MVDHVDDSLQYRGEYLYSAGQTHSEFGYSVTNHDGRCHAARHPFARQHRQRVSGVWIEHLLGVIQQHPGARHGDLRTPQFVDRLGCGNHVSIGVGNRPDSSGSLILPGKIFGWAALLRDQPRRVATASCLEDSTLYVIPREKLLELFDQDYAVGYQVMHRLATTVAGDFVSVLSV